MYQKLKALQTLTDCKRYQKPARVKGINNIFHIVMKVENVCVKTKN